MSSGKRFGNGDPLASFHAAAAKGSTRQGQIDFFKELAHEAILHAKRKASGPDDRVHVVARCALYMLTEDRDIKQDCYNVIECVMGLILSGMILSHALMLRVSKQQLVDMAADLYDAAREIVEGGKA